MIIMIFRILLISGFLTVGKILNSQSKLKSLLRNLISNLLILKIVRMTMMTFMSQSGMERSALRRSSLSIYQSMMMAEAQVTIMMIMIVIMMMMITIW